VNIEALTIAWEHVQASDARDGAVAPSVRRFAENPAEHLAGLHQELTAATYQPRPLTAVMIPKGDGSMRELQIPSARDRVVEKALQLGLNATLDHTLLFTSTAYRSGIGVGTAVRRLVELRNQGRASVVRADIHDCFPSIDRNRLLLRLEMLLPDPDLLDLIGALVRRPVRTEHRLVDRARGIPQGGALSPMLSNVVLDDIDRHLLRSGHQVVRYADDLAIATHSAEEAAQALASLRIAAERAGLELGEDKSMITSFQEGFHFLGEDFNERYPPYQPTGNRSEPTQRTLYVGRQGAGVRISRGRLIIDHDQNELLSIPTGHVERIVLSGAVGLSAGARSWALNNDIDVILLSRRGSFLGTVAGGHSDAGLLRAQLRVVDDPDQRLNAAREIVQGKLRNQEVLLLRFVGPDSAETVEQATNAIKAMHDQAVRAVAIDELRGVEGMAARSYWAGVRAIIPEVGFEGRHRRPPPDLINSALGYGYAVLLGECVAACHAVGLHPSFGLLHDEDARRPSLALDLMEEFRPLIVDQVVVELTRRRSLTAEHVRTDTARGGVLLTEKGRRRLTAGIEDRLLTTSHHFGSGHRTSYRRIIHLQASALNRLFRRGEPYEAIRWR
jgi:CRISPR-associated protein Cas1